MNSASAIWYGNRILLLIVSFGISLMVGNFYVSGDQFFYNKLYEGVPGTAPAVKGIGSFEIVEAFQHYTLSLSSKEIIHFLVVWSLSNYISKLLLMSLFNTFLSALIIQVFDSLKVNFFVTVSFVLSNYYLYVLFFSAERLKFGFIMLLLGLLITFRGKLKNGLIAMSVLGHFQMIIVIAPILFQIMTRSLIRFFLTLRLDLITICSFIPFFLNLRLNLIFFYLACGMISLFFLSDHLYVKFQDYYSQPNIEDFLKIMVWFILTFWYTYRTHSSNNVFLIFIPLFFAVYLIGDERVNMIAYLYFLVPALQYRRGLNLGILISTIYFAIKTIFYVESILRVGHGFG